MRLVRIEIRNFRLLRRVTVDLAQETATVLVGPNNSGKTSLIDAIRLFSHHGTDDRKRLQIHDFSKARRSFFQIAERRLLGADDDESRIKVLQRFLPTIRISMTFEYTDTAQDLNIASPLLMDLDPENNRVTVRIEFSITNALKLWNAFRDRRKPEETTLYDVLAENLHDYYSFTYFKVSIDGRMAQQFDASSIIGALVRVDTISAQRHIDDDEDSKAAKLSKLLHSHYTTYIRKEDQESYQAIEDAIFESAQTLTDQYGRAFNRLLQRLHDFGYPQGNEKPDLTIKAEMNSATIYRDNTKIYYAAPTRGMADGEEPAYVLPERYNGLGYKNLIYIVLQLESFRAAIEADPEHCPGVHLIGIEEPEAHLHPQMQAVFIKEISRSLTDGDGPTAQVILSTHSSHMVADSGFSPIRYFKCEGSEVGVRDLSRLPINDDDGTTLMFLRRYIKLTHCDLLFADKAILVEGQVEKLLLPAMIEQVSEQPGFERLASQYITILEIGGTYAHKIEPFLRFIGIPALVIADIDSAKVPHRTNCPVAEGEVTTNAVIGYWLQKTRLEELHHLTDEEKTIGIIRVAYQRPENGHCGRSFEEAFVYANLQWIADQKDRFIGTKDQIVKAVSNGLADVAYEFGKTVSKVDFALDLMTMEGWRTPAYIDEGLKWLAGQERYRTSDLGYGARYQATGELLETLAATPGPDCIEPSTN